MKYAYSHYNIDFRVLLLEFASYDCYILFAKGHSIHTCTYCSLLPLDHERKICKGNRGGGAKFNHTLLSTPVKETCHDQSGVFVMIK